MDSAYPADMAKPRKSAKPRANAKPKAKAKRYTPAQKDEILAFIKKAGRGGQTKAVAKFGVTAATLSAWKKKAKGAAKAAVRSAKAPRATGASKELRAIEELRGLLKEMAATEAKLDKLKAAYAKAKAKL